MEMMLTGVWLLCILNYVVSIASKWNISPFTGSQAVNNIEGVVFTRSAIECVLCAIYSIRCKSVEFKKRNKECLLVNLQYQDKCPFTKREDVVHFSTSHQTVCPFGYDHLPISHICAKLFVDRLYWNNSLAACKIEGADLPILDTESVLNEFLDYIDNRVYADDRVAVNARLVNNVPIWGTGAVVDSAKFCYPSPDVLNIPDVCIYIVHKFENWCYTEVYRFDDEPCEVLKPRICVIKL